MLKDAHIRRTIRRTGAPSQINLKKKKTLIKSTPKGQHPRIFKNPNGFEIIMSAKFQK